MNYFKESDSQLIPAPVNFKTPQGRWIMNFNKSPQTMALYYYLPFTQEQQAQWRRQHPSSLPPVPDTTDFDNACQQFRDICHQIGQAIDQPNFKGGFEQMTLFAQSPIYSTIQGLKMAIAWTAANEACQHEAAKLGLYTPGDATWWFRCWQQSDSKQE